MPVRNSRGTRGLGAWPTIVLLALLAVWLLSAQALRPASAAVGGVPRAPQTNRVTTENALPGTDDWASIGNYDINSLQAFVGATSVNAGGSINIHVKSTGSSLTARLYRLGYYQDHGARFYASYSGIATPPQPDCTRDDSTGLVSCPWAPTFTINTDPSWISGFYLVRLDADNGYRFFVYFVLRNDGYNSDILVMEPSKTNQAYNDYGGESLYYKDPTHGGTRTRAYQVSFDRPYSTGAGTGALFTHDTEMVRWLEASGYDVSYISDIDRAANPGILLNHRVFMVEGHDEYWTWGERDAVEAARDAAVNVIFASGNESFWRIRLDASTVGPNRVITCYKDAALDPSPDKTITFRDLGRPENSLVGTGYQSYVDEVNYAYPWTAYAPANRWYFDCTGLQSGDEVNNIVSDEWNSLLNNGYTPPGIDVMAQGILSDPHGNPVPHHSTIYTTTSGSLVFAAGSIVLSWGLIDHSYPNEVFQPAYQSNAADPRIEQMMANIIDRFAGYWNGQPRQCSGQTFYKIGSRPTRTPMPHVPTATGTAGATATQTRTPSGTNTPLNTATASPTRTSTIAATGTPSTTPMRTATNTSTSTPSTTSTSTPTRTPTNTPTQTSTSPPTRTTTFTPTFTVTNTPTSTLTDTPSTTPTGTPTGTPIPTNTATNTATASPSTTPTNTPTLTATPANAPSNTPTNPPSNTPTSIVTPGGTVTASSTTTSTSTPTNTPSVTPTVSRSVTYTNTPSLSPTNISTSTPTRTPSNTSTSLPTGTPTGVVTVAPSMTATNTSVVPTGTSTATPAASATFTPTITMPPASPTHAATAALTATFTLTAVPIATATRAGTATPTPVSTPVCSMTYNSVDLPRAIPDQGVARSLLVINDTGTMAGIKVTGLTIQHTYASDLSVYLISPQGTRVTLFTNVCGSGIWTDANTGFTITENGSSVMGTGCPPGGGSYRPEEGSLLPLLGQPSNGTWTLEVSDGGPYDAGTLDHWGLWIGYAGPVCPLGVTWQATATAAVPSPTPTSTPAEVSFVDVPAGGTFYPYVQWMASRGYISGYGCGAPGEPCPGRYFRPNASVTRGQLLKMVVNAAGWGPLNPKEPTFADVPRGSTFYNYIETAFALGIVGGYPCGGPGEPCNPSNSAYFRPGNYITRGQLSKVITLAEGYPLPNPAVPSFADVPATQTFFQYVETIYANGIISGYACGGPGEPCDSAHRPYFRPYNSSTRGQVSKVVRLGVGGQGVVQAEP